MRILHITPSYLPAYEFGGPVKTVHELCAALVKKGIDVSVFTTNITLEDRKDIEVNKEYIKDGVKVTYFPISFPGQYCYSARLAETLNRRIQDFDIIHLHSVYRYTTLAGAGLCQRHNKPYILNPFGALDPSMIKLRSSFKKSLYIKLIESRAINGAKAIHVASQYEKENFEKLNFKTPAIIIPRGINLSEYSDSVKYQYLKRKYPELSGKKIILFLGRIHQKKGFNLLAAAFKRVVNQNDAILVVAGWGEGGYVDKVKRLFKGYGICENVIFTNMLLGEDKLSAFFSSDIFILPSYGENFGIAALEAMACGLPVVTTDCVGLSPDIDEYKAGIITDCDAVEIAEALHSLLDSEDLRKSMGENGKRLVRDRFTLDKMAGRMFDMYKTVLSYENITNKTSGNVF
jgi:glycosyltransferase involved in cell wall biosynthesis